MAYYEKRFGLEIDIEEAQERFANKVKNLLDHLLTIGTDLGADTEEDIKLTFCNNYVLEYTRGLRWNFYLTTSLGRPKIEKEFSEFIVRLNYLVDVFFKYDIDLGKKIIEYLDESLKNSPIDLNLQIIKEDSTYSILPAGSECLTKKL